MYPTIKEGSTGDIVKVWQKMLGPPVVADGDFGPITKNATIAWQSKHGLAPSGIVDNATWEKSSNSSSERTQEETSEETSWTDLFIKGTLSGAAAITSIVGVKWILKKAKFLFR